MVEKEVIALEDGYRQSAEPWASLFRDLKRRDTRRPRWLLGMANSVSRCVVQRKAGLAFTTIPIQRGKEIGITDRQIVGVVALAKEYGATPRILFGSALEGPEQAQDLDPAFDGVVG